MSLSMHSVTTPVFLRMLSNLVQWLDKAEAHAAQKKFDPSVLLAARLAPDMLALTTQVQIACDTAKFAVARLAGVEAPKFDDNETSIAELKQRVQQTMAFVESVPVAKIDGSEQRPVSMPRRGGEITLQGEVYLKRFVLPNFFFHLSMTYALLRHNGVELGKMDYLGALQPDA